MYFRFYLKQPFFIWVKTDQGRMRCDADSSEVFHIIDSINIELGPNWQPSTTKMAVARLGCDADSSELCFISLILSYKVRKKIDLLRCTANQVGTGRKLRFRPKIQLGSNWQQSTTKMAVARLRCDADSLEVFYIIDTII